MNLILNKSRILITLIILVMVSISCGGGSGTTYSIEVSPTPQEGGSVSPAEGEYEEGARVEVSADPNEEWIFSSWQGDVQGTENPVVVTVDGDKVFTALFEKKTYPLNITIDGEGTVDETVIQTKNKDYEVGTTVELSANPAEGWEFVRWEGDLESSSNPEQVTVNEETNITAVFERSGFELEITVDGEGSVSETVVEKREKIYEEGAIVELTAEPDQGWRFVRWEGDLNGSENPEQITVDEDKEVKAIFERRDYALNINTEGEGSVGEEVIQSPKKDYAYETVVELTASAAEGWKFERWEGDLSGSENPEQITIDEEKTVTAVFSRIDYTLDITVEGEGSVTEEISQNPKKDYAYQTVVELTAEAEEGWAFVRWEGDLTGSENPEEITMDSDKSVTAIFEEIVAYDLNVTVDGEGSVSEQIVKSPNKSYEEGTVVELNAEADQGWEFVRWEGDLSGSDNPEQITVDSEKNVTAVFEEIAEYPLNITVQGEGRVEESVENNPNKSYQEGTVVELDAQPEQGWEFVRWEGDLSGSENPEQITMDSEKNVTAVFEEILYELDLNTDGQGSIIVEPSKDFYSYGDEIEVRARPNELWTFLRWEDDLSGEENPQTITVNGDLTITAVFGGVPKVRTAEVFDMRVNSAMSGGEVTDAEEQEITERGICWSRDDDQPNLADDCAAAGSGLGSFDAEMTGLAQAFTYHVRAYAKNRAGYGFGKSVSFKAGYVSHGFVEGLTPNGSSQFEDRSYKLVEANWKGGGDQVWIETNLGATGPVKDVSDTNPDRAGWYFQFNRMQGHYYDDGAVPGGFDNVDGDSGWEIGNDPCRAAFGGSWRVPTDSDWRNFLFGSGTMDDATDAFNSPLRLHMAGAISGKEQLSVRGSFGYYYSSDHGDDASLATLLYISNSSPGNGIDEVQKSGATTIRCMKD